MGSEMCIRDRYKRRRKVSRDATNHTTVFCAIHANEITCARSTRCERDKNKNFSFSDYIFNADISILYLKTESFLNSNSVFRFQNPVFPRNFSTYSFIAFTLYYVFFFTCLFVRECIYICVCVCMCILSHDADLFSNVYNKMFRK